MVLPDQDCSEQKCLESLRKKIWCVYVKFYERAWLDPPKCRPPVAVYRNFAAADMGAKTWTAARDRDRAAESWSRSVCKRPRRGVQGQ